MPAAPAPDDVSVKEAPAATGATATKGHDTLSVDFPDEEIRNILRNVAELFDLNIVIPETLQGKTSVKLHDVTWRQIFQVVLTPVGYTFIEDGNIIKVVSNESLTQEPVSTEIFVINYAKAADIQPTLASLVDTAAGGKIVIDGRTNSLVITERPSRMKRIRPVIEELDRPTDQVMIESKFVEISNNDIKNIGVNWSSLSGFAVTAPGRDRHLPYQNHTVTTRLNGFNNTSGNTTGTTTGNSAPPTATTRRRSPAAPTTAPRTHDQRDPDEHVQHRDEQRPHEHDRQHRHDRGHQRGHGRRQQRPQPHQSDQPRDRRSTRSRPSSRPTSSSWSSRPSQQLNNAKIVSNPTIVTLNNTEASINVGQQYPIPSYTFNQQTGTFEVSGFIYKDIGIILKVTPQVNARGFIKLTLQPEVSQNQGTTSFGGASGASIPIIGTRKAVTQVSLKDGYTMGIGGLISTNFNTGINKVPLLGDIPLIGYLFKPKNTTTSSTTWSSSSPRRRSAPRAPRWSRCSIPRRSAHST